MASSRVTFVSSGSAEAQRRELSQAQHAYREHYPDQRLTAERSFPQQVTFVDGKCTCCPYGYHIDLDFLNFCRDMEKGSTLQSLKKIQKAKRKLRKSMEIMLDEQGGMMTSEHHPTPPDVVNSTEAGRLMHMINYERSATNRILNQIDSSVNSTIGNIEGGRGRRYLSSDSDEPNTPGMPYGSTTRAFDESGLTPSSFASGRTDSLSSLSSVSTVSSEAPMMYQAQSVHHHHHHQQQQQQFQQQHLSRTHRTTTKVIENPVVEMGTAEVKHYSSYSSAQLVDNGVDESDFSPQSLTPSRTPPIQSPSPRASPDINQMSLQSVREAMAVSLQRLRELEEQVKAIPILQVRISVLKEEKRLLNLQLKASKANSSMNTRSIGVGNDLVYEPKSPPPTLPKPVRTVGVGDHSVVEPYLAQPDLPTGYTIRENETHTEIHTTSVFEKESVFHSRMPTPSLNMSFRSPSFDERQTRFWSTSESQPRFTINQIQRSSPKALTRTVGIGDGNVFEGSGLHVHEKEMRTVIIGSGANVAKRNVGIECRVPTRDVGVSFMCDEEKPQTRTIGVNVRYDTSDILTSLDFKGETQLRTALRGVLQRNVHSVGTNCNFRTATVDAAVETESSGVSVGCGDEEHRTDVEVRPLVAKKTISVTAKPDTVTKCCGTEKGWALDASTNTVMIDKYSKAIMTDRPRQIFASSNTEPILTRQASNQTEVKMFLALDQLKNAYCNTQKATTYSSGMCTDVIPKYTVGVNTTEKFDSLVQASSKHEKKKRMVDRGTGDGQVDIQSDESSGMRKTVSVQEQIIKKGVSQANDFLSSNSSEVEREKSYGDEHDSSSQFSSYEIKRRSSAPIRQGNNITSHDTRKEHSSFEGNTSFSKEESTSFDESSSGFKSYEITRRSSAPDTTELNSSTNESQRKTIVFDQDRRNMEKSLSVSPPREEDSFSEIITEYFVITKDGKQLISEEKEKSITSGGKTTSSKSKVYGPGASHYSEESADHLSSSDSFSGGVHRSNKTNYSRDSYNNSMRSSSHIDQTDMGAQQSYSSTSSSGVITNPYKTVENLAEASFRLDSESSRNTSAFREVSKTGSESNLSKKISNLSGGTSSAKSMDTVYDIRRAGSVEDFMPEDIRKYMSIDPSNSKDSGFGEELHQKFLEDLSSSRSSSSGPDGTKYMQTSRTITKRRSLRSGDNVSVQETKTVQGSDGKTIKTYTENSGSGNGREDIESGSSKYVNLEGLSEREKSALSETMQSSTSSYASSASSGYGGGGSDSNLAAETYTQHSFSEFSSHSGTRAGAGMSVSEITVSSVGQDEMSESTSEMASYGSLDRRTGQLKSIMKQTKSETERLNAELSEKKGITFAESVTGGTGSSTDGNSSDSDSTSSFEEGSYDSRQGQVSFQCQDDEAIAQGLPGAQMFDQNIRETYELSDEMRQACNILATYLTDSTTITTKQLNASANVVQQEWFRVSSHKLSTPHEVEDYLSSVNEISKRLLEYIVNMTDANGNTAIHYCISHCNLEIASLLLDSEVCDINKQNKAGYTPIMLAGLASVQNQEQREVIRRLFARGDINARATATQQTALMLAASHGRTEMVCLLVEEGANYNLQDVDGSTALMCACEHGHLDVVTFLLAQPDINAEATDNENCTALSIAMEADHKDVGVVLYKHLNFSKASSPHSRISLKFWRSSESTL